MDRRTDPRRERSLVTGRSPFVGTNAQALAQPDHRLASSALHQRTDRSGQQLDQAGEASRLRISPFPQLQGPCPPLRRQAQLGSNRHRHSRLKSDEPN